MIKHVILWKLKDDLSDKKTIKQKIKDGLEQLKDVIPGIVAIHVQTEGLATSNADLLLDSTFESEAALKAYATHPAHVDVAHNCVIPYVQTRLCLDFTI